ncbi:MAG: DNA polymerase IV, partial [Actinomycetota bacterium]|nr:DNA polymerase IV [Actinomycetota bacterium]
LVGALGPAQGSHLHELAWGRDPRAVVPDREVKSVGHEETYPRDHHEKEPLRREVIRLSDAVATRLVRQGLAARTVTLKMRFGDFRTVTRSKTAPDALTGGPAVAAVALRLLDSLDPSPGVRLLGVSASNLEPAAGHQLSLDEQTSTPDGLAGAVEDVRRRFGDEAVGPAALVGNDGVGVRRLGDRQWGPDR